MAVSDLAARYTSAAADQQPALISAFVTVDHIVGACFSLGSTLYGIGFVLTATAGWALAGFPRWLAAYFMVSGATVLVVNIVGAASTSEPPAWGLVALVVFVLGLHAAIATAFWRRA
jgi:hypothetical protein